MKKNLLIAILATVVLFVCFKFFIHPAKQIQTSSVKKQIIGSREEKEDGIAEAQEMEFENTKDIKLGYIPKYRLIRATEDLRIARMKGTYAEKVDALGWSERGPNTDFIGPVNSNTRGTQAASDAVTAGRIRAIWVDLADASNHTVWAGGVSGGLWKTNDITSTAAGAWAVVNDFFANLSISSICQDPTNTNIMYFGTGEKTFNADAVRGGGIWKSIDHGLNWSLLANTTSFFNVSKILCDASGNVYVAIMGGGLQRSTDNGGTWTDISPILQTLPTPTILTPYITEIRISNTGRLHVVCGYRNTGGTSGYVYTDIPATVTSTTWTSPTTSFPTTYNTELAVAGATLYALPANASYFTPQIYKSTDGGDNWAVTPTSPPGTGVEPSINPGQQGWYDLAIGVDPANPNNVVAGGLNFYRSTDGGATWAQITRWVGTALNYVHADHHAVVWNGTQVLVGCDGGLFYSNNNGVSFADRNDGLRLKQFYSCAIHPTTANYFLAGAQDNGTHLLTNAGLGGSTEVVGGDGAFTHIDQDEPQYQFGAFTFSDYLRTTDGGASWDNVTYSTSIGQFINPTGYDDIRNKMYASAGAGQYVRWENPQTGSTFTPIAIPSFNGSTVRSLSVSRYTANRVFFGTAGGRIVKVDNADQAVPAQTNITGTGMSTATVSCIALGTDDNNLLTTFSNYGAIHVWVTATGGGAGGWTNISGNLPDIPVRWAMFYPEDNTKAIIATEMGIYETNLINGASTVWTQNASFPTVKTNMLQYRYGDNTVLAATHGRGLWTSNIPPASPYIRFASAYTYSPLNTEATSVSGSVCRNYKDYTLNMHIDQAPAGAATVTLNVSGGTATQGVDYDFTTNGNFAAPSSVLTFPNGATADLPVTIRVYNDAEIEGIESFTLSYSVSGATNAVAAPSSLSYTFYVDDNDLAPTVPGTSLTQTIGTGDFGGYFQPLRGNFQKAKSQYIYLASELTAAGFGAGNITSLGLNVISKTSTIPYTGLTISLKNTTNASFAATTFETGAILAYSQNYSTVTGMNTLNLSTPFNWDGTSNLLIEICYDNATATGSGDLVSTNTTVDAKGVWNRATTGTGCALAAVFNSASGAFVRPDITLTGANGGNPVETVLNNNRSEFVANNGTYYFYNGANIINSITNASANLGCVSSNVFEAGNTWQTFSGGLRSQKVIEIIPTTNPGASYTVSLYYTAAELAGKAPATLKIAKTTAATMAAANAGNTIIAGTTSFTAYGTGYLFTASFTGFSKFFLVDNNVSLPVTLLKFDGRLVKNVNVLEWSTSSEQNSKAFDIEKSSDGINFYSIGTVPAARNSNSKRDYSFTDNQVNELNYYRLKMTDMDSRFLTSQVVLIRNPNAQQDVRVVQNPFQSNIIVRFAKTPQQKVKFELTNVHGAVVYRSETGTSTQVTIDVSSLNLSKGVYLLRTLVDNKTFIHKLVKQ
jgi:trimeric autotransporter adhesin